MRHAGQAAEAARLIPPSPCAFDPGLARHPTRELAVSEVVDLLDVTHAPDQIEIYRQRMAAGDRFPPVSVILVGPWVLVADGHKRFSAFRTFSPATVVVEVWPLYRWLGNQVQQLLRNARKNASIVRLLFTDPPEARRLAGTTLAHWRRVAVSLSRRARRPS